MKKNIIGLRTIYNNGQEYLYGDAGFYLTEDPLTEQLALAVVAYEAIDKLSSEKVKETRICYINCEYNFDVKERLIYKEYPVTVENCQEYIDAININNIPTKDIVPLEILPDWCYNESLHEKILKIKSSGKCIDWTIQNSNTEWDNNGWWYLHGELEDSVGYDKAVIINANSAGVSVDSIRWSEIRGDVCVSYKDIPYKRAYLNGIYKCKTIGVNKDCLGFFYVEDQRTVKYDKGTFSYWMQRGYVTQKSDKKGTIQAWHGYIMNDLD